GPDEDHIGGQTGCTADFSGELVDSVVRTDFFSIRHSQSKELTSDFPVDVYARDDQGSEEVSFPALVDPEMRFEHCRVEHFLVADTCLFQDFRFQIKPDEIFGLFALNDYLGSLFV